MENSLNYYEFSQSTMYHIHSKIILKRSSWVAEKMDLQGKVSVTKPHDLSSVPGTLIVEGKTNALKLSSDLMS